MNLESCDLVTAWSQLFDSLFFIHVQSNSIHGSGYCWHNSLIGSRHWRKWPGWRALPLTWLRRQEKGKGWGPFGAGSGTWHLSQHHLPILLLYSRQQAMDLSDKCLKPLCICDVLPSSSDVIILQPSPHILILKDPASNSTSSLKPFLMPLTRTSHSLFWNLV